MLRRKRLEDGSFGELEKVFSTETPEEKAIRLEKENKLLKEQYKALDAKTDQAVMELSMLIAMGGM